MIGKSHKRTLGLFLLIGMLLLGICLEGVQTDSLFLCAPSDSADSLSAHPESAIASAGKTFPVPRFIPGKSSDSENAVVNTRRSFNKTNCRTSRNGFDLLCADCTLSSQNSFSHSYLTQELSSNIPNHIIIIQYIHLQDGQKSDSLFS